MFKINKYLFSDKNFGSKFYQNFSTMESQYFKQKPPAKVGDHISSIETPSLVLDLDKFEYNLKKCPEMIKELSKTSKFPILLRPHYKTHKCPAIASLQKKVGGASGICCAKLTEVESLVFGSHSQETWDILLTNEIIGSSKINRLHKIAKKLAENSSNPPLGICVDSEKNISDLVDLSLNHSLKFNVYVELNVGQDRCGADTPEELLNLVKMIKNTEGLYFKGILAYNGINQHTREYKERQSIVLNHVNSKVQSCLDLLKKNEINCEIVTGGGTGSFPFEIQTGNYNEVQPGSYIFMDADYNNNFNESKNHDQPFKQSIFIYTRVLSQRMTNGVPTRLIVDAGLKSLSLDSGPPKVVSSSEFSKLEYVNQGDEHGKIQAANVDLESEKAELSQFTLGDVIKLIPGHCDPTVNMYDYIVAIRGDTVESVWSIEARGPGH